MVLSIFGSLISAFAFPLNASDPSSVFVFLSISRLILGIGVGGVYPLSATIAAESSNDNNRGRLVSIVFSMQGVGTLLVPLIGMVILSIFGTFKQRSDHNQVLPGISWRLILGIGALPGICLLPFKTANSGDGGQTVRQGSSIGLRQALMHRRHWPNLIGCAGGWFLFDVTFYGNVLFAPTVLKSVFHAKDGLTPVMGPTLESNLCLQLTILALLGLPGYYVSVWLMDRLGRKTIQLQGFVFMAVLYAALGLSLGELKNRSMLLLTIYGLTYFFSNFGPNSTTFILPSECFPREVRTSLNGFCAAMGKVGATLGSALFKPMVNAVGTDAVFYACAVCAGMGVLLTIFFVEDRRFVGMEGDGFVNTSNTQEAQCAERPFTSDTSTRASSQL